MQITLLDAPRWTSVSQSVSLQHARGCSHTDHQLINNAKLAVLFTETLQKKFHNSPLPYVEGTHPSEVKSWREFVPEEL